MKSSFLLLAATLWGLQGSGLAGTTAVAEMVEVEVRFFEATSGQVPKSMPIFDLPSGADPLFSLSSAPTILSVNGVLSAQQAEKLLKELKGVGARLLDRQKTVVLSGHKARVQNVRELRYPSTFEISKAPLPEHLYPTSFETKSVGSEMELEPTIGPDKYTIDLIISPRIVEFQGFIDATQIPKDATSEQIQELLKNPPKKGSPWQPVFNSREIKTEVTVYDGQTVLLSSPITTKDAVTVILVTARILPTR